MGVRGWNENVVAEVEQGVQNEVIASIFCTVAEDT